MHKQLHEPRPPATAVREHVPSVLERFVDALTCRRSDPFCKAPCSGKKLRNFMPWDLSGHADEEEADESNDDEDDADLEWQPPTYVEAGARYTGQWRGSVRQGEGVLEKPDGGRYEGNFRKGKAHGHGKFAATNGNVYEGQWDKDRAQGEGMYTKANGAVYKGQWYQDHKSGTGSECWPDGSCYNGEYLQG